MKNQQIPYFQSEKIVTVDQFRGFWFWWLMYDIHNFQN
jgi:hypothetical protein